MVTDTATQPEIDSTTTTKLYVGSLPYTWTAEHLEEAFKPYGPVASAAVVADQNTHRSKGFGFVEFESGEAAQKAMAELNGREIEGRNISVREARPHTERSNGERIAAGPVKREKAPNLVDNSDSTDTSGRSYGNRRGWW